MEIRLQGNDQHWLLLNNTRCIDMLQSFLIFIIVMMLWKMIQQ